MYVYMYIVYVDGVSYFSSMDKAFLGVRCILLIGFNLQIYYKTSKLR